MNGFKTALIAALLTAAPVALAEETAKPPPEEVVQERLLAAKERLQLTDEQVEQMKRILEASMAEQKELLAKYGIDPTNPNAPRKRLRLTQARSLRSDMSKMRKETLEQLEPILSEEQMDEFKKMQEEQRKAMKKRIQVGR